MKHSIYDKCSHSPKRRAMLYTLARKYGWVCWYCGDPLNMDSVSIDHIIPRCDGGSEEQDNLALCCVFCNYAKKGQPVEVFLAWLERVRSHEGPYKVV